MKALVDLLSRLALVGLLALSLGTGGLSHAAPSLQEAQIDSFIAAGGSLADLCAEKGPSQAHHADCPACHLPGAILPPETSRDLREADLAFVARIVAPRESRATRAVLDIAHGLRAPPLA